MMTPTEFIQKDRILELERENKLLQDKLDRMFSKCDLDRLLELDAEKGWDIQ